MTCDGESWVDKETQNKGLENRSYGRWTLEFKSMSETGLGEGQGSSVPGGVPTNTV